MFGRRTGETSAPRKPAPAPASAPKAPKPVKGPPSAADAPRSGGRSPEPSPQPEPQPESYAPARGRSEEYYDVKTTVFNALIDTIDLTQLAKLDATAAREEIRDIVSEIIGPPPI